MLFIKWNKNILQKFLQNFHKIKKIMFFKKIIVFFNNFSILTNNK